MKIYILHGYRGVLTREQYWPTGERDVSDEDGAYLIANGHARLIEDSPHKQTIGLQHAGYLAGVDMAEGGERTIITAPGGAVTVTVPDVDGDRDEEDVKSNSFRQLDAAFALLEGRTPDVLLGGRTPDVLLGEGLTLSNEERAILKATGHPVTPESSADIDPVQHLFPLKEGETVEGVLALFDDMTKAQIADLAETHGINLSTRLPKIEMTHDVLSRGIRP